MPKKISLFLSKALYITFLALLLIAFAFSINAFVNPDFHFRQLDMNFKWIAVILLIFFLAGIYYIIKKTHEEDEKKLSYSDILLIFLIAFCLRLIFLVFYGYFSPPFADSMWAHMAAMGWGELHHLYDLTSSWAIFSVLLREWYLIAIPHIIAAYFLNTIVTSVTAVFIYILAMNISEKRSIALVAAIVFTFYPHNIFLSIFITPEHIAVLLTCIIFILLLLPHRHNGDQFRPSATLCHNEDRSLRRGHAPARTVMRQSATKHYILCAIIGIICAFADILKQVAPIIIIAYVITTILAYFIGKESFSGNTADNTFKFLSKLLLSIIIISLTLSIVNFAVLRVAERTLGIQFANPRYHMTHFIYVGLQPSGEGQVFLGDNPRQFLVFLEETGRDFELARIKTIEFLKQEIRENPAQFAALFPQKFRWAWQDDTIATYHIWIMASHNLVSIAHSSDDISPGLLRISREVLPSIAQIFYMSLLVFSIIGLFGAIKELKERFNYGIFFISLYCFGFFLLLLIMEAQSRYKVMIIPCLCILAAYGYHIVMPSSRGTKRRNPLGNL